MIKQVQIKSKVELLWLINSDVVFKYRNQSNDPNERPQLSAEIWKQQTFDVDTQDSSKAKKNSFDSGVSPNK